MAQRRPIASHPAFVPLVALWFAALFGLGVAVLPVLLLELLLAGAGLTALVPLTPAIRIAASIVAALGGMLFGLGLGRYFARRAQQDPRPIFSESEPEWTEPLKPEPSRRPLSVREELSEEFGPDAALAGPTSPASPAAPPARGPASGSPPPSVAAPEGFMILTPQPVHPPRPAPDLEALLAQFDEALAAFRTDDAAGLTPGEPGPDPVHAFVARQTGNPPPLQSIASPLGGPMPDHQAELRAALDKLARAHRRDE